ncbi:MAG: UDP-glucose 4-epimerase GalE [Pseudomonadota bacterium]
MNFVPLKKILLTGGLGYIGSHTATVLMDEGIEVVLYDNLCNASESVLARLETITSKKPSFIRGDIRDTDLLTKTLRAHSIDGVIHFAGLKAVAESVAKPIVYYDHNVGGTMSLLKAMGQAQVKILVFSSSATVYGNPQFLPITEDHPVGATNPYAHSKLHIEQMLIDLAKVDQISSDATSSAWRIASLRYFNPVGAHESGLIGENPKGIPDNLMPYIVRVAQGSLPHLKVFGDDYETKDGTGVRDYIHVMDLAYGHVATLDLLRNHTGWHVFNLGTGVGISVFEMIKTFEAVTGQNVSYRVVPRRAGDIATSYAKVDKVRKHMGWRATQSLDEMCVSAWNFQSQL